MNGLERWFPLDRESANHEKTHRNHEILEPSCMFELRASSFQASSLSTQQLGDRHLHPRMKYVKSRAVTLLLRLVEIPATYFKVKVRIELTDPPRKKTEGALGPKPRGRSTSRQNGRLECDDDAALFSWHRTRLPTSWKAMPRVSVRRWRPWWESHMSGGE